MFGVKTVPPLNKTHVENWHIIIRRTLQLIQNRYTDIQSHLIQHIKHVPIPGFIFQLN